ncbi:MAG: polysaccharide deacetylase family protein [Chloroflexota bacterium]
MHGAHGWLREPLAGWRQYLRGTFIAAMVVTVALSAGLASPAYGQAFQPQPPADAPHASSVCRPAAPAVEKTPGASVRVDRGPTECNAVTLTFDAGADRGYAELILDILRDEHVPASFGMTGAWAQQNSDLVMRIVEEGHELINHTWSHQSFTGFSAGRPLGVGERRMELDRTEELLVGLTNKSTRPLFRPPYGDLDDGVFKDLSDAGYDYTIMWTVDSLGWNRLPADGIVERCLSRAEPGAIYIFHVGEQSADAQALPAIIAGLRERGFTFATVTDLLGL